MRILLFRAKVIFLKYSKNLLLIWKLLNRYGKWLKILFTLWVMPIDKNIFELFSALVDDTTNDNIETTSTNTTKKIENLFYITFIAFCVVVIYYTFFTGNDGGDALSNLNLRRVVPEEPPKISINDEGDFFVSLLDETTNVDVSSPSAAPGPIISKHW